MDTTNLKTLNVYFQNKTYTITNFSFGTIDLNLQVNSNIIDTNKLSVEGFYYDEDTSFLAYDEINVNVVTSQVLTGFNADPEVMHLFINEIKFPSYYAIYQTYTTNAGRFSQNIFATINDSSIVYFDSITKGFKGINIGETFAVVDYLGLSDTIYFIVSEGAKNSYTAFNADTNTICKNSIINFQNKSLGNP